MTDRCALATSQLSSRGAEGEPGTHDNANAGESETIAARSASKRSWVPGLAALTRDDIAGVSRFALRISTSQLSSRGAEGEPGTHDHANAGESKTIAARSASKRSWVPGLAALTRDDIADVSRFALRISTSQLSSRGAEGEPGTHDNANAGESETIAARSASKWSWIPGLVALTRDDIADRADIASFPPNIPPL